MREYGTERPPAVGRGANFRSLVNRETTQLRSVQVSDCDPQSWVGAIEHALAAGWGLTFSRTTDGGAISVTLYAGEERFRTYCSTSDELAAALAGVRERAEQAL